MFGCIQNGVYLKLLGNTHFTVTSGGDVINIHISDAWACRHGPMGPWRMGAAGPHSAGAGRCSPAPSRQQASLGSIGIFGARRFERAYGRPRSPTPTAVPAADESARARPSRAASGRHRPALDWWLLASPAAPADGRGLDRHLRRTALRTGQQAATLAHAHRHCATPSADESARARPPCSGTGTGPHLAGGCSPAPRRQQTSLGLIGI